MAVIIFMVGLVAEQVANLRFDRSESLITEKQPGDRDE
jgi:hypothetical protein